jgi:hypothetical protein|tara:strand:+ start:16302 stop:16412 length:111 start_codon:yes stop_codon:yes gene_type:complete
MSCNNRIEQFFSFSALATLVIYAIELFQVTAENYLI